MPGPALRLELLRERTRRLLEARGPAQGSPWDIGFHHLVALALDPEATKDGLLDELERLPLPGAGPLELPPLLAYTVWRAAIATGDLPFVHEVLPILDRFYQALFQHRDADADGLVSIFGPHEAYFPDVELSSGAFPAEPVDLNALLVKDFEAMARLAELSREAELALVYHEHSERTCGALEAREWSEDKATVFCTLFAGVADRQRVERLVNRLKDPHAFWMASPVPTVACGDSGFDPRRRGRGAVDVPLNWLITRGLADYGFRDLARELAKRTLALVEDGGFHEAYDPFDGAGFGGRHVPSGMVLELALMFPG